MTIFVAFYKLVLKFFSAVHPFLIVFFFFGLVRYSTLPKYNRGELYLATYAVPYFILLWLFFLTHHYSSKRYFLPIVILVILWCGLGCWELSLKLSKKKLPWSAHKWATLLVILAMAIMLPKSLEPLRKDHKLRKEIGVWLRENGIEHPVIISREPRFAFYARGKTIPLKNYNYPGVIELARKTKADYLIINTKDLGPRLNSFLQDIHPEELALIKGEMQARREQEGDKWLIYSILEN